ncbi:hypothetical protein CLU79DRAFT_830219 [Phycomyces nitens]|nr:hypothetical protein CLU79DRAFT_830219 [Phycomyces nitens]
MSHPSKEWIKQRMTLLKRQTGFSFSHDLFISVLLCLMSGRDKHAILTTPSHRLPEVAHMATQICRCLFGFTTANITCHANQSSADLIQALFQSTQEEDHFHPKAPHTSRDPAKHHKASAKDSDAHVHPISPVDFTLMKRDRTIKRPQTGSRERWESDEPKRPQINRLPQCMLVQSLDQANPIIQAALLELVVTKELKLANTRYNLPKPFFLLIVLPEDYNHNLISAQLLDRIFVSYTIGESAQPVPSSGRFHVGRRAALIKSEEIKQLGDRATEVYIDIDISRYIRDIVVGVRTHPLVIGGLTARASQELVLVTKSLAVIFGRDYLTPDLVSIAAEKVFGHRLRLASTSLSSADIVAEILRVVYVSV